MNYLANPIFVFPLPAFFFLKRFFSFPSHVLPREGNAVYLQEEAISSKPATRMLTKASVPSASPPFKKGHSKYTACILSYARFLKVENHEANMYLSSPIPARVMALDL